MSGLLALPAQAALYTSGHADVFAIGYVDEETPGIFELEPHLHVEGAVIDGLPVADEEFEPGDVTIVVPQSTFDFVIGQGGRSSDSAWDAVGVVAGAGYWFLPQTGTLATTLGAPFAGVGTEELNELDWSGPMSIALESVAGPGVFSMWLDGAFGPDFLMSTADGIDGSDLLEIDAGGHEHYNWGFSAPGTYDVTVTMSGTHNVDGFQEAMATYQFQVVPEPSTALLGLVSAIFLVRRRR